MTAPIDFIKASITLFTTLAIGVILAYLSQVKVEVKGGEVLLKGPLYSREYELRDLVEFVDIGLLENYNTLRVPGLALTIALNLVITTAVFAWGYSSALPLLLAVPTAFLSGICFLSLEVSTLFSPSLGIRGRPVDKLIIIAGLILIVLGALLVTNLNEVPENTAFVAGSMIGLGIGGILETFIGNPWSWVFKLSWDEETVYVLAFNESTARKFKEELLRAMRDA